MTTEHQSIAETLLRDIETTLETATGAKRVVLLRRMTDLFLDGAAQFGEVHVALFDDLMEPMLDQAGEPALAELSERLAPICNAPMKIIWQLATSDAIAVCAPVLRQSERLNDYDLAAIARTKGDDHLIIIAARERLAETVAEALLERGDAKVARTLAANPKAQLSKAALAGLVRRAANDLELANRMANRPDVPVVLSRQLFRHASGAPPQNLRLRKSAKARPAAVVGEPDRRQPALPARDYSAAERALRQAEGGTDLQDRLFAVATAKKFEDAAVTIAALAKMPVGLIERLLTSDPAEGVLVLGRAVGLNWPTVRAVLALHPGGSASNTDRAFRRFSRLSPVVAQKIVRFWRDKLELSRLSA